LRFKVVMVVTPSEVREVANKALHTALAWRIAAAVPAVPGGVEVSLSG
jgi:hypothetical protein